MPLRHRKPSRRGCAALAAKYNISFTIGDRYARANIGPTEEDCSMRCEPIIEFLSLRTRTGQDGGRFIASDVGAAAPQYLVTSPERRSQGRLAETMQESPHRSRQKFFTVRFHLIVLTT